MRQVLKATVEALKRFFIFWKKKILTSFIYFNFNKITVEIFLKKKIKLAIPVIFKWRNEKFCQQPPVIKAQKQAQIQKTQNETFHQQKRGKDENETKRRLGKSSWQGKCPFKWINLIALWKFISQEGCIGFFSPLHLPSFLVFIPFFNKSKRAGQMKQ